MTDSFMDQMTVEADIDVSPFDLMRAGLAAYEGMASAMMLLVAIKTTDLATGEKVEEVKDEHIGVLSSTTGPVLHAVTDAVNQVAEAARALTKELIDTGKSETPPMVGMVLADAMNAYETFRDMRARFGAQERGNG